MTTETYQEVITERALRYGLTVAAVEYAQTIFFGGDEEAANQMHQELGSSVSLHDCLEWVRGKVTP